MQLTDVQEIIACLPKCKTPFWYFKDRYALLLLGLAVRDGNCLHNPFVDDNFSLAVVTTSYE